MDRLAESVLLREALANDVQKMADIERAAAIHPWSLSQFLSSSLRDNDFSLVVEDDRGGLVGFCIFQQVLDQATLMNIAVHPDSQGAGQGGLLLAGMLQQLPALGVNRCLLEVRRSNLPAIALYRHYGFVEDGVRSNYYPTPGGREDALLMSCELVLEQ